MEDLVWVYYVMFSIYEVNIMVMMVCDMVEVVKWGG